MKIAILATEYPSPEDEIGVGATTVVYDFAHSWAKSGHEVVVYHNLTITPGFLKIIPQSVIDLANARFGYDFKKSTLSFGRNSISKRIEDDGVFVRRFPMRRLVPKRGYSHARIRTQYKLIKEDLDSMGFIPDIIVGHWEDPQIELLYLFKELFGCKVVLTIHGIVYLKQSRYLRSHIMQLAKMDVIFARSEKISQQLSSLLNLEDSFPICRSGIEELFFRDIVPSKQYRRRFAYAGRLVPTKHVDCYIDALYMAFPDGDYELRIMGTGPDEQKLRDYVVHTKQCNRVKFLGWGNREDVADLYRWSSVYAMVSENETFGLSYLEAMACDCISIASTVGGMQGIINDGENGFTCEAGNTRELAIILQKIDRMSSENRNEIISNARETAKQYSSQRQSMKYLSDICAATGIGSLT